MSSSILFEQKEEHMLLELAGLKQIISEPRVHEIADKQLQGDWAAQGFWELQKLAA